MKFALVSKHLLAVSVGCSLLASCAHQEKKADNSVFTGLYNNEGEIEVVFRNVGSQIVSFDYTVADRANVNHVDADGPNSGLVENLYPGAVKHVKNPMKKSIVWTKFGRLTYGKRTPEDLAKIYRPYAPKPEPISAPGTDLFPAKTSTLEKFTDPSVAAMSNSQSLP